MKGVHPSMPLYIQHGEDTSGNSMDGQMHSIGNIIHPPPLNNNIQSKILYTNGPSSMNDTIMGSSQPRNRSTRNDDPPDPPDPPDNGSAKRKYRRHPKRDKNAPVKPLSAYVMFAHKVREEYAGQNIPFPDMAKIVGDRWKNVGPKEKEMIENEASKKKEEYQAQMAVYKTTESWKKYQEYLKEFKEKYESNSRDSGKRKRHKTEASPESDNATPSGYSSTRSTSVGYDNGSGNTSSGSSGNGNGNGNGHHHPTGPYSNHAYSHYPNYPPQSTNYIPPYPHYNPTVPYGYTSNNNGQNVGNAFITPPPSINTNNNTPTTTLADLYAKDDSNAGDDQSQLGNGSSSGNGSGNGNSSSGSGGSSSSRSAERPSFEDSDNSTTSSSNSTPPAETDDNSDLQQSRQNQNQHNQHQDSLQS